MQCSDDFWEERSTELFQAAEAEVEKARQELARELTSRWGAAETLDLRPYFEPILAGLRVPEPLKYLGTYAPDALVWRRPAEGRWLALSILKQDTELPYELAALVGDLSSLVEPPVVD